MISTALFINDPVLAPVLISACLHKKTSFQSYGVLLCLIKMFSKQFIYQVVFI